MSAVLKSTRDILASGVLAPGTFQRVLLPHTCSGSYWLATDEVGWWIPHVPGAQRFPSEGGSFQQLPNAEARGWWEGRSVCGPDCLERPTVRAAGAQGRSSHHTQHRLDLGSSTTSVSSAPLPALPGWASCPLLWAESGEFLMHIMSCRPPHTRSPRTPTLYCTGASPSSLSPSCLSHQTGLSLRKPIQNSFPPWLSLPQL